MSPSETLAQIVDIEAGKLLKRAQAGPESLCAEDLESLEVLSRCAKALRSPAGGEEKPDGDDPTKGMTKEQLLAVAEAGKP
jgi:hypothetical protein